MSQSDNKLYEFGEFRLDAAERLLWHGEQMLTLASKVFDTLWTLVEQEGWVVSKAELMEAINAEMHEPGRCEALVHFGTPGPR